MAVDKTALWEKVGYHPHPKQVLFHNSLARFKVPVCGRRFGKSKMAAAELLPEMMDLEKKGNRYWIVGPTYDLGEKEFRYLWDDVIIKLGLGPYIRHKAYNVKTGDMHIQMPWGTRVDVKSADHPDGLVGEGLAGVIVSEAAKQKRSAWEKYLRPALADLHGWAYFPSTPEGYNWYYDIYRLGLDDDYPEWESWNFPSWENPYVYPLGFDDPEIQSQKRSEEDPWFWQEIGADFRSFVGKIYPEWHDDVNILNTYEYRPEWASYMFFDFGFANPFVALDVQIDPSDNIYIWREYYVSEIPIHRHAMELRGRVNPEGYTVRCGFGDSADPGAVETLSSLLCPVYAAPDAKDWMRGIQEVKKFLADPPHLYVHKSCVNTIFEFQNYRMKQAMHEDVNPKEDSKKWSDHSMDAIRYGIMHLYVLGARYHLRDVMMPAVAPPTSSDDDSNSLNEEKAPDLVGVGGSDTFFQLGDVFKLTGTPRW
jgi:hypothetical protein